MADAVSPEQLAEQIRSLRPTATGPIMVHASLRRVGPVVGGATGVIEAVRLATGPRATMVMMVAAADEEPFDRLTTEADEDVGVLAEEFRTHPGVTVNDHPACRFAALGPDAADLLDPQPVDHYYGPGSTLERLYRAGVQVLRLGSDIDTVTLTHYAEYLAEVPHKREVTRHYVRADTGPLDVVSLDDSDGIAVWPRGDYFGQILVDFVASGAATVGPVAGCTAELLDGRTFVDFAVAWMERELAGLG